jgi:hypothetical protein
VARHQSFFSTAAAALCLVTLSACQVIIAAESKRVMMLHSFGREFGPWNEYAKEIRTELERQSPWPLDITDHSPITPRFGDEAAESAFVEYLRALYVPKHRLDLISVSALPQPALSSGIDGSSFPPLPCCSRQWNSVAFSIPI